MGRCSKTIVELIFIIILQVINVKVYKVIKYENLFVKELFSSKIKLIKLQL